MKYLLILNKFKVIFRRLGNKNKVFKLILLYFLKYRIYIFLFFGVGGMYFNKLLVVNNFLNDNDENVYNLFEVVKIKKDELVNCFIDLLLYEFIFN